MTQTTLTQLNNLDDYGYPLRPDSRRNLRNIGVQTSKRVLLVGTYLVMSIVGFFLILSRIGKRYPPLTPQTFHPKRILLIRLDLIGDLVLSLTTLRVLKRTYPEAEIDLLAVPSSAKVAAADPDLAEIIAYDSNIWRRPKALFQPKNWREAFALLRRLHARQYDLAVSIFGSWA